MADNNNLQLFSNASWPEAIAHIDADAFFVECERATDPSLKNRCVVVGKERGIVTALSYEAKRRGVKRGMRIFEAKRICKGLIIIESDYEKYSLFSVKMFDILREFSPIVEEYSIDEAFMDITGLRRLYNASYTKIASIIQETIKQRIDLSVSIGVAPTKVLAKIGSKLNKPYGITAIKAKEIQKYINGIDIGEIWGIGKNTSALLKKLNINTALDFALTNEHYLKHFLSKPYLQIWKELRGIKVFEVNPQKKSTYKSISKARSFHKPTNKRDILIAHLINNLEGACLKARMYHLAAKQITIFIKTNDFQTSSIKLHLKTASNLPIMLTDTLKKGFNAIYDKNLLYRQTGVVLSNLVSKTRYDLFENIAKIQKISHLYKAIDKINIKYGRNSIHIAKSSISQEKQNHCQKLIIPIVDIDI